MNFHETLLITGGAGFIGSHTVRRFLRNPQTRVVNVDALTYAGNLENLVDVADAPNYVFERVDITEVAEVARLFAQYQPDGVIHLAAESHVDRSIADPMAFVRTNVFGTVTLLNAAKEAWKGAFEGKRFYHVSTDEVYGSLHDDSLFLETTPYDPQSPYSASKAASDHFVRAYGNTYKLHWDGLGLGVTYEMVLEVLNKYADIDVSPRDGGVTLEELKKVVMTDNVYDVFEEGDIDGDGVMSWQEFVKSFLA